MTLQNLAIASIFTGALVTSIYAILTAAAPGCAPAARVLFPRKGF